VLSFDVQPFPRKETRLVEGQTPCNHPAIQSIDPGCLEGILIRRSIPASHVLTRSRLFGGEGCKKNDGTGACSPSRSP